MPDKTPGQLERNGRQSRVDSSGDGVMVASSCGPRCSEVGSVVSHQEFVAGKYQDVNSKAFGPEVLADMVAGCEEILVQRATG